MKLKLFFKVLFFSILFIYPFIIYFGFQYFSFKELSLFIFIIFLLQLLFVRSNNGPLDRSRKLILAAFLVFIGVGFIFRKFHWVKLYPIFINIGLGSIFGLSLRQDHTPIVEILARLKEKSLPDHAVIYTRKVTVVWTIFFFVNCSISLYTFFFSDLKQWTLYNGFLSYIFIGLLGIVEYLIRLRVKKKNE